MKEVNMQRTTTVIDAVIARNIRTFAVLCATLAAPLGGTTSQAKADFLPGTQQSEKRKLIHSWQSYFRALRTLEYAWVMKGNTNPDEPGVQQTSRYTFLWNGRHVRLDTEFSTTPKRKPYDYKSTIQTHDGKFYRILRTTLAGERRFDLSAPPVESVKRSIYVTLPVLHAFGFVFEEDDDNDPITIEALQKDDIWRRFEKRIVNIKRGVWQGRQGRWLFVEDPEYSDQKRIFVDGTSNFPLFVAGRSQLQLEGKHDYSDEEYDSQVTRTMKWHAGSTTYVFPLRFVRRDWSKEVTNGSIKRVFTRIVQEVTAPVKINKSLKTTRLQFDIPAGTLAYFAPEFPSKEGRPHPFVYDPKGGSLWAQEQRQRQRVAQRKRRIAALPKIYDEKTDGKAQIDKALKEAKENNKRVLLQFGANWCGPCHTLNALFTKNSEIASILHQDFVVAHINVNDHNKNLTKQYRGPGQNGIPFLVVLEIDGKRLAAPPSGSFDTSEAGRSGFDPKKITAFLSQWKPKTKGS
jgi:thiol-disulfide isomerase/thioredoxin